MNDTAPLIATRFGAAPCASRGLSNVHLHLGDGVSVALERFALTFTPKHGSWLNLIEGFFSKFARSVLRHIRVASKHELKDRIMAGIEDVNRYPVIHTWSYKLADAA